MYIFYSQILEDMGAWGEKEPEVDIQVPPGEILWMRKTYRVRAEDK